MGALGNNYGDIGIDPAENVVVFSSGTKNVAITAAATTQIKTSPGLVGTLINAGATTSGTITIYDSLTASGTKIWSGTLTAGQVLSLGIPCVTGITIVTAAAGTALVSYA